MKLAIATEKTKRRVRAKTPFGPSLKAFGIFTDDKAKDWDQLDWDRFDFAAFAESELADDLDIPVGTEMIEVAFEAFDQKELENLNSRPEKYVSKAIKKGQTEASVKNMTDDQKGQMKAAKMIEIRDWLANDVIEKLPPHLKPGKEETLKTRWVLTWKKEEATGGQRAKARLVVLGFQDPRLGEDPVASPTMTRRARNLMMQFVAWKGWKLKKGDVKAAFLQGKGLPEDKPVFIEANEELAEELGIPVGDIVKLKKAVYGLCQAPKSWYESVDALMESLGG